MFEFIEHMSPHVCFQSLNNIYFLLYMRNFVFCIGECLEFLRQQMFLGSMDIVRCGVFVVRYVFWLSVFYATFVAS